MPTPSIPDDSAASGTPTEPETIAILDTLSLRVERRGDTTQVEVVGTAGHPTAPGLVARIAAAVAEVHHHRNSAGTALSLAADHPADSLDGLAEAVAHAVGLTAHRDLLQMRRTLPVSANHPLRLSAPEVVTRSFRPGLDDQAWIRVNNRAFADHPDQGRETASTLGARIAGEWFDPHGFLVADDPRRPGELAGFCWTKVHPASGVEPALGEIYVIGVDPSRRGEGLGPSFVLAGLGHLAASGLHTANLYVDADNEPARRLYDRLGFTVYQRRRVYTP